MASAETRDVAPETQQQLLDEAQTETDRAIANGWHPATTYDVLAFGLEQADRLRQAGWDPAKIAWEDHAAVLRGELVPDKSARLLVVEDVRGSSWSPVDLLEFVDAPPEPPTIGGLVYPGRRHVFSGEPETLKTWAALVLCAEQIKAGHEVVYIDFEMGAREHAARLRALGLTDEQIAKFLYITPEEPMTSVLAEFESLLGMVKPPLVVIDAFTGALAMHNVDPNSGVEVERFYQTVIGPMQRAGAAAVLLDHVTKNRETRGRYSIGSERKLGGADVHLGFELVRPFGRGKSGLARVMAHKDRPGYHTRPKAAEFELYSDAANGAVTWQWRFQSDEDSMHRFRPTGLMERVSLYVAACGTQRPSRNDVEETVTGKREYVRIAIDVLVTEGYLLEEDGPHGARLLRSEIPFRESGEVAA